MYDENVENGSYCSNCKNKIDYGNTFCSYCGNVILQNVGMNEIIVINQKEDNVLGNDDSKLTKNDIDINNIFSEND